MGRTRKTQTRTTAQRGYGTSHQRARAQLLPRAIGTHCPLRLPGCDGLMLNPKRMDLDHSTPLALGGRRGDRIVCAHCNRSAGATLGNRMRGKAGRGRQRSTPIRSRRW